MTRKTKSWLLVVGVLLVGLTLTYFGGRYILIRRIAVWRADGMSAAAANDNPRAATLLEKYLRRRPDDIQALAAYAHSRELAEEPNGQHLTETIVALKMLIGLDPNQMDARHHLLELYSRLERRPEAIDTANAILAKNPNDLPTLRIKADVLMKMGQDREALAVVEKWSKLAPLDLQANMDRVRLRKSLGQSNDLILSEAKKLHDDHPNDARFELLLGYAYSQINDDQQAGQWLKTAAKHPDLSEEVAKTLVSLFDQLGLSEDSLAIMEAEAKNGRSEEMRHALGRRLWELGRWEKASQALSNIDPANPSSDATLLAFRAMAAANLGHKDEAEKCRAALASRNQAAAKAWTELLHRLIDGAAIDDKKFIVDCRVALGLDPSNIYLDYYLGDANARLGELDLAIKSWERVVSQNIAWSAPAVRLVEGLLQKGQPEQALFVASTVARRGNAQAAVIVALAKAWAAGISTGGVAHSDELLKLVTEVQQQLPNEDQTLLIRIQLLAQKGGADKEQAKSLLQAAIDRKPPVSEELLTTLATISHKFNMGLEDKAFAKSEEAHGLTSGLAYAKAVNAYFNVGAEGGRKVFDEMAEKSGKSKELDWQLARVRYLDNAGHPDAAAEWKRLVNAYPKDLAIQKSAVGARAIAGDWDVMPIAIDHLKALTGDTGLSWRLAQARLQVTAPRNEADVQQGSVALEGIISANPSLPEPHVLMARALSQMKRPDGAIDHLTKALKLDPTSVPIALQLASLLQSQGDYDRVNQELDRVLPRLKTPEQRRQAALLLAQQGKTEQASKLLEQQPQESKAGGSRDDDLLLAMLYRQRGEFDKVEPILQKLLEKPDLSSIKFAVAYYLGRNQHDKAETVLGKLDSLKLDPGIKDLTWAAYYLDSGDLTKAEDRYRSATKDAPANAVCWRMLMVAQIAQGHGDDAIATLGVAVKALPNDEMIKSLNQNASLISASISNAQTRPIAILAVRDPQSADAALELLGILSDWRASGDADRMIARLQQLVEHSPNFLPARRVLVDRFASLGRTGEAIAAAQQTTLMFPKDPDSAQILVDLCASTGRWQEANTAAQSWRQRMPDNPYPADVALARTDLGLKDYPSAIQTLQPHIAAAMAAPDNNVTVVVAYAVAMCNTGKSDQIGQQLWPLATKSSQWRMRWLQIAVDIQDKIAAEPWVDRLATIVPTDSAPEMLSLGETYDNLAKSFSDTTMKAKADAIFASLAKKTDLSSTLLTAIGFRIEESGDSKGAEELYRRALKDDPKSWMAHNNLAMLLAKRGGQSDEAQAQAAAAVQLEPRLAALRDTLAFTQSRAGLNKNAIETMNTAIKMEPDNPQWRVRLVEYLLDDSDKVGASKAIAYLDDRRLDMNRLSISDKEKLEDLRKKLRTPVKN